MGLLNHLFGSKTSIAKELLNDNEKLIAKEKRWELWQAHVKDHPTIESLVHAFSYKNIDATLADWPRVLGILGQIEKLTRSEIIEIEDVERLHHEILDDLDRVKSSQEILRLSDTVKYEKHKQQAILEIFKELHHTVKVRLHLIQLIRWRRENARELLTALFSIIYHNESMLHKVFREDFTKDSAVKDEIRRIAKAVIVGEKLKEEVRSDEEKFAEDMLKEMGGDDSESYYRKIAEEIWTQLMIYCGAPIEDDKDFDPFIKLLEETIDDSKWMENTVKKLHPKFNPVKIRAIVLAFQKAFNLGHFDDWEEEFFSSP